ncbi:MAG: hypothetical protein JST13_12925, partial [Bacteroidetes bacterium]|nr:hypothetical protein [Bacteroidota bacterium]
MKKLISLLPVIFVVTNIFGQTKLPPPYEITTDTIFHNISLPDSKWQMIADPSGKITFQQILQSGQFQDTDKKINYHIRAYWLRYRFINKMQKEAEIAVDASGMARVDLYLQSEDGSWQHLKSGKDVSWGKRDGLKRAMFIKLTIPAGKEIMVYQRDYFNYLFNSPTPMEGVHFSFTKNVIQQQYVDNTAFYKQIILNSFLLGLILLAIIINLYFFRIVREKEFSYFILFLLGMALQVIAGLNADTISVYPLLSLFIYYIGNIVTFFFFMQFFRHFLKTFSRFPRWDKYLIAVSILFILGFSFSVFGNAVFKANLLRLFWLAPGLPALLY